MKVVVLKEGVHDDIDNENPQLGCKEITSSVTLLKGDENIIVDTGNLGYEEEIVSALEKEGLKPEDITVVLVTHLHLDHISNHHLFKNARRMTGSLLQLKPDKSLTKLDVPEGVKIIKTPGHLPTHYAIVVESEGKTYVIAGDAIQESYLLQGRTERMNEDYIESALKIVEIADVIIPGHGRNIEGKDIEILKEKLEELK